MKSSTGKNSSITGSGIDHLYTNYITSNSTSPINPYKSNTSYPSTSMSFYGGQQVYQAGSEAGIYTLEFNKIRQASFIMMAADTVYKAEKKTDSSYNSPTSFKDYDSLLVSNAYTYLLNKADYVRNMLEKYNGIDSPRLDILGDSSYKEFYEEIRKLNSLVNVCSEDFTGEDTINYIVNKDVRKEINEEVKDLLKMLKYISSNDPTNKLVNISLMGECNRQ